MNEIEAEHRMTEVEQRAKSNTHRLDKLEPIVDEIHTMSKTMVELVQEVKHTNEAVNSLDAKVDRMDNRVDEMEKAPAKRLNCSPTNSALCSMTICGPVTPVSPTGIMTSPTCPRRIPRPCRAT